MEIIRILSQREEWSLPNEIGAMIGRYLEDEKYMINLVKWKIEHTIKSKSMMRELNYVLMYWRKTTSSRDRYKNVKTIVEYGQGDLCISEMSKALSENRICDFNKWGIVLNSLAHRPGAMESVEARNGSIRVCYLLDNME